ncbi:MAG: ATP-binding cassette domain-containing protein [Pseudomonadota bacterium]
MGPKKHQKDSAAGASLRAAVAGDIRPLTLIQSAALLLRLLAMLGFAQAVGRLVMTGHLPLPTLLLSGLSLAASCLASIWSERWVANTETKAANVVLDWFLRFTARASITDVQAIEPGDLAHRLSRQPGAAAGAVVSVRLGKTMSALGALAALVLMAILSWQAALILLLTMPIMVLFFIVIGRLTKAKASAQEVAIQELSGAFAEKIRCLPTITACDASEDQALNLGHVLTDYRIRSSQLLRVAFLNAAVLDFFSSLSIAMLAIFLGLGHLGLFSFPGLSGLSLSTTLGLLILAPEVFQPLRRYAELYHQAAEGEEALKSLDPIATCEAKVDTRLPLGRVGTRGVVLANHAVVGDWDLPSTGLIAITGPSGSGKTMLLKTLAGVEAPLAGQVFRAERHAAWVAVDAWLAAPTNSIDEAKALAKLRLTDDPRFRDGEGAAHAVAGEVSGGQRVRFALAHALTQNDPILFADEPTAKLDHRSAEAVRAALSDLAAERLVIVATHDPVLTALAVERVDLGARSEVVV